MKIYTFEQRSDAWYAARLGIPTASNFSKIVTPAKCELSKTAVDYALRLCAERLLNMTTESSIQNEWMERGVAMEAEAVRAYEWQYDAKTIPVGFITDDEHTMGCSPDRLLLEDGRTALEIKSPAPHVHLRYLLEGIESTFKPQIQGQCLIAELDRVQLFSWHPQMPPALVENVPDEDYLAKLSEALTRFKAQLADMYERALKLGVYQPVPRSVTPVEAKDMASLVKAFQRESAEQMIRGGFVA